MSVLNNIINTLKKYLKKCLKLKLKICVQILELFKNNTECTPFLRKKYGTGLVDVWMDGSKLRRLVVRNQIIHDLDSSRPNLIVDYDTNPIPTTDLSRSFNQN